MAVPAAWTAGAGRAGGYDRRMPTPAPPASRPLLDALFRPQALVAVLLAGEALAVLLALAPGPQPDRLVTFGLVSLAAQWIALGTLALVYLLRAPLARLGPMRLAWACLGLYLATALLVLWGAAQLQALAVPGGAQRTGWLLRQAGIVAVVGLLGLLAFRQYWHARQLAVRAKQLELQALQARVRPHFLFNALNTGAALVHAQPDAAERVLLDLADLFRAALRGPQRVPLAEELALARRYLDIEALRLGARLRLDWRVPDPPPAVEVPVLSVQPLVENAIRHGIEPRRGGGRLEVEVRALGAAVEVLVRNDLPDAAAGTGGHAIGLAAARRRVEALAGARGELQAGIEDGRYVARLRIAPDAG